MQYGLLLAILQNNIIINKLQQKIQNNGGISLGIYLAMILSMWFFMTRTDVFWGLSFGLWYKNWRLVTRQFVPIQVYCAYIWLIPSSGIQNIKPITSTSLRLVLETNCSITENLYIYFKLTIGKRKLTTSHYW